MDPRAPAPGSDRLPYRESRMRGSALRSSSSVAADRRPRSDGPPSTEPSVRAAASSATTSEHYMPRPPAGYRPLDFAAEDAPRLTH